MKSRLYIYVSVFLLITIVFAAFPKTYIHSILGHNHSQQHHSKYLAVSDNNETQDCTFEKFDTTVTYTVNDFHVNFHVNQVVNSIYSNLYNIHYFNFQFNNSLLRGPPIA